MDSDQNINISMKTNYKISRLWPQEKDISRIKGHMSKKDLEKNLLAFSFCAPHIWNKLPENQRSESETCSISKVL